MALGGSGIGRLVCSRVARGLAALAAVVGAGSTATFARMTLGGVGRRVRSAVVRRLGRAVAAVRFRWSSGAVCHEHNEADQQNLVHFRSVEVGD